MRYIQMQPDVMLHNIEGNALQDEKGDHVTISLKRFILGRLTDPSFAADMASVLSALQIREAVERADNVIEIETEDWKRLAAATKTPQGGYNAAFAHCLVPFMKAITEASEKRPE